MIEFFIVMAGLVIGGIVLLAVLFKLLILAVIIPLKIGIGAIKLGVGLLIGIPIAIVLALVGAIVLPVIAAVALPILAVLAIPLLLVGLVVGFFKLLILVF